MYQSDTGYKGAGGFLSAEGLKADMAGTTEASANTAKEGSALLAILQEFSDEAFLAEKLAHGSPFVWSEVSDGKGGKTLSYLGGVDAMREYASERFAASEEVQKQNVSPTGIGVLNIFGNPTPGLTVPAPLQG